MTATFDMVMSQDATFRRATSEDVPGLARTYVRSQERAGAAADRNGITLGAVTQWMRKALLLDEIWMLEREFGEVAGLVAVTGRELDVLDVEPNLRGRGYGSRLVEMAKRQRPGGLIARVSAHRVEARRFLFHHGFEVTGPTRGAGVETLAWGPMRSRWQRGEARDRSRI